MGEAAGVAAVHAVDSRCELRDVDIQRLQTQLVRQGAVVERPKPDGDSRVGADELEAELTDSIHHRAVDQRAYD
jgi:hypothetical protein